MLVELKHLAPPLRQKGAHLARLVPPGSDGYLSIANAAIQPYLAGPAGLVFRANGRHGVPCDRQTTPRVDAVVCL